VRRPDAGPLRGEPQRRAADIGFRKIARSDVKQLFVVRAGVRENPGELLRLTEGLSLPAGHPSIRLWTGPDRGARAFRLRLAHGWTESEARDGRICMSKNRPCGSGSPPPPARR
jgi:hypothetical protein